MAFRDQSYTAQDRKATDYPPPPSSSIEALDNPECPSPVQAHTLPEDMPPERLRLLISSYRSLLNDFDQDALSYAYCEAVIAEAETLLADREVAA